MLTLLAFKSLGLMVLSQNLLDRATIAAQSGVTRIEVLHDGQLTYEGDTWNSEWSTVLAKDGSIVFTFPSPTHLGAALIQGDNNDTYTLSGSLDGVTFTPLWNAKGDPLAGMRTRRTLTLDATVSSLKLTASGGDGLYSLGELAVYDSAKALESTQLIRQKKPEKPVRPPPRFDTSWLVLGAVAAFFVWFFTGLPRKSQ